MYKDSQNNVKSTASLLGIRGRLILGFTSIVIIFMIAFAISLAIVHSTKGLTKQVVDHELPLSHQLLALGTQVYSTRYSVNKLAQGNDATMKIEFNNSLNNIKKLQSQIDQELSQTTNSNFIKTWNNTSSQLDLLQANRSKFLNAVETANNSTNVESIRNEIMTIINNIFGSLEGAANAQGIRTNGLYDTQFTKLQTHSNKIISDMSNIQLIIYISLILSIILSIIIALYTSRSILRHINIFREFSNKIASGDLRHSLNITTNDEIGQLGTDLNTMTDSLSSITKQITVACHDMITSLEEVRQAVNVQSTGANEQASSINQITASLEEIEKSSNQTMEKAKSLGQTAELTREKGQLGLNAVEQSIKGMKTIREKVQIIAQTILDLSNQTQQVGEITSAVNSLAQQSKMLALNAAIEASKAGEAGKGFAVVASEVKNLAEQSEESTAQVQKILEDIRHATEKAVMVTEEGTKGVDAGTGLVEQTGEIVRNLSDVIYETTIASQQIEAAVRQESVGIEQITSGMNEINQVTASFVASANQTLEAINNLGVVAKNLKERVDTYKID